MNGQIRILWRTCHTNTNNPPRTSQKLHHPERREVKREHSATDDPTDERDEDRFDDDADTLHVMVKEMFTSISDTFPLGGDETVAFTDTQHLALGDVEDPSEKVRLEWAPSLPRRICGVLQHLP